MQHKQIIFKGEPVNVHYEIEEGRVVVKAIMDVTKTVDRFNEFEHDKDFETEIVLLEQELGLNAEVKEPSADDPNAGGEKPKQKPKGK